MYLRGVFIDFAKQNLSLILLCVSETTLSLQIVFEKLVLNIGIKNFLLYKGFYNMCNQCK